MQTFGEYYDDMLDEVGVGGLACLPPASRILKEMDPTAYNVGFSDFLDDPNRFACSECGDVLTYDDVDVELSDYPICSACRKLGEK